MLRRAACSTTKILASSTMRKSSTLASPITASDVLIGGGAVAGAACAGMFGYQLDAKTSAQRAIHTVGFGAVGTVVGAVGAPVVVGGIVAGTVVGTGAALLTGFCASVYGSAYITYCGITGAYDIAVDGISNAYKCAMDSINKEKEDDSFRPKR